MNLGVDWVGFSSPSSQFWFTHVHRRSISGITTLLWTWLDLGGVGWRFGQLVTGDWEFVTGDCSLVSGDRGEENRRETQLKLNRLKRLNKLNGEERRSGRAMICAGCESLGNSWAEYRRRAGVEPVTSGSNPVLRRFETGWELV